MNDTTASTELPVYGQGDATYQGAGGYEGLERLVNRFYDLMDSLPEVAPLRAMHSPDLSESRIRLTRFLSAWTGGPKLYSQHYGTINIPRAHAHLPVDRETTEQWLMCMDRALVELDYPADFRYYLMAQLRVPAERVLQVAQHYQQQAQQ
ncbi:group II truncated hemoglobin [Oceanobacter mangrovi]|uniref:group II truncated hemoglobin n=1 Tax=Oceanobacter mangrovi TaxID=2862510 RepID=UPI001C8D36D0|nr:group II truncated hemoglobin [Oceanobacter mangrovi]